MPDFVKNYGSPVGPWGVNEFLRSTRNLLTESFTFSRLGIPKSFRDGNPDQRILQPGTAIAKITSGGEAGKCGVFQSATGTAEVQTITKSGTWTSVTGTYDVFAQNSSNSANRATMQAGATASDLTAALALMPAYADYVPVVTGGPLGTTAFTITFGGDIDADVPQLQFDGTNLVGGTSPSATTATSTAGVAGDASDGRQTLANLVGICITVVPWQLTQRDVEISVIQGGSLVQAWCIEYNAAGLPVPLTNTTAAALQRGGAAGKSVDIKWN